MLTLIMIRNARATDWFACASSKVVSRALFWIAPESDGSVASCRGRGFFVMLVCTATDVAGVAVAQSTDEEADATPSM